MPLRIIVNGAQGKMGILACQTLRQHPSFDLVAELGRKDTLAQCIVDTRADIVLDLTSAESVYENGLQIIQNNAHPVIGTSGLTPDHIRHLKQICDEKQWGGLIVPNFSLSAVLMMRFATIAAQFFPDVEIIEAHHPQKLDAPSGTAIKTAETIAQARRKSRSAYPLKELMTGARGATHQDVSIHSVRLPGILARQQVIFGNQGETLSITHDSIDRQSFMPGVILACQHVTSLNTLYYGLEHVMSMQE